MTTSLPSRIIWTIRGISPGGWLLSASIVMITSSSPAAPTAVKRPARIASARPRFGSRFSSRTGSWPRKSLTASAVPSVLPSLTTSTSPSSPISSNARSRRFSSAGSVRSSLYAGSTTRTRVVLRRPRPSPRPLSEGDASFIGLPSVDRLRPPPRRRAADRPATHGGGLPNKRGRGERSP